MIYRHVNKRTKILPIATFRIAHLCNQFNHVRPANFHATFWSIYFYQNIPKINSFLQKNAKFCVCWELRPQTLVPPAAEGFFPRPPASGGCGLCPQASQNGSPIVHFWLRAKCFYCCHVILCKLILRLADVYGFPQAVFCLNKFAHTCHRQRVKWFQVSFVSSFCKLWAMFCIKIFWFLLILAMHLMKGFLLGLC